jgi:hypothetical protein
VLEAGAKVIHVDVMDGHFVPPITMGPLAVERAARADERAGALLDVHLMIERPERQVASSPAPAPTSSRSTPRRRRTSTTRWRRSATAGRRRARGLPVDAGRGLSRGRRRSDRSRALHDRQPGLGRPAVHRGLDRQARALRAAARRRRRARGRRRHRDGHGERCRRPAPACSSPAPRCSARPTRPAPTSRSPRPSAIRGGRAALSASASRPAAPA